MDVDKSDRRIPYPKCLSQKRIIYARFVHTGGGREFLVQGIRVKPLFESLGMNMDKRDHDITEALRNLEFIAELLRRGELGRNLENDQKLARDMSDAIALLKSELSTPE